MEGIGKRRSRGLLLKDGIGREGNGKGEEGRGGRRKGGEQPVLTVKNGSRAPASKHQFGRPVTMLQTSWPLMGFAIRKTPQIP